MMNIRNTISKIENNRYLNWKVIILLYLITRISIVLLLNYGAWNDASMLCYASDCKQHWRNAQFVVDGINPYLVWKGIEGSPNLHLVLRADHPPFMYILLPSLVWIWRSVWAMLLLYFIFDFINLYLISNISKFKKIPALLYISAPSFFRGLIFAEDEIMCVAFALASIYFLRKNRYSLSTIMLALSFNLKFFPIILFPALLLSMSIFKKFEPGILPKKINYSRLVKQVGIFVLITAFFHSFFYPHWDIYYQYRAFHYTLASAGFGIWSILPIGYYPLVLTSAFILFYLFSYIKNLDIKTTYLLGSLIFISTYPRFSVDHLIFLIPLFLIWTRLNLMDTLLWIFLSITVILDFLALPTIGIFNQNYATYLLILVLLGFYLIILNRLRK